MKNVLICLEKFDIGGVETAVFTQASALLKQGINVVILAQKGMYVEKIVQLGATFEEICFDLSDDINFFNVEKIIEIIEKYNITEVHINQVLCIPPTVIACIIKNTPYVLYEHITYKSLKEDENNFFDYFENNYYIYKTMFKFAFECASMIIAITDYVKTYISKRYDIHLDKIHVIHNSIDFSIFNNNKKLEKLDKMLIISRMSSEKLLSIYNGLKLYDEYAKENKNCTLEIAGDGPERIKVEEYINDNILFKDRIILLGARNDIKEVIQRSDIVIGLGRCILEAVAMKKVSIISGYDELKEIINISNINECINLNFSGYGIEDVNVEQIKNYILSANIDEINRIVEENYSVVYNKLNIENNIYLIDNVKTEKDYLNNKYILIKSFSNIVD